MSIQSFGWTFVQTDPRVGRWEKAPTPRRDDPNEIASDKEAATRPCDCLIHSTGRPMKMGVGQLLFYKTGGDESESSY